MPKPPVKAQAVAADLAPKIFDGTYPAESWLPSERELPKVPRQLEGVPPPDRKPGVA